MKKTIFLLLLLAKVYAATATDLYKITVSPYPTSGKPIYYVCQVAPDPSLSTSVLATLKFTDRDLVTWIFPDGQYLKKIIGVDANGDLVKGTDTIQWRPYVNALTGPDEITVYVAKKGGQGNPGRGIATFNGYLNSTPESFFFPTGKIWQINRTWEFSPGNETFLIFSYKPKVSTIPCSGGNIKLTFKQGQIVLMDKFGFNNETLSTNGTLGTPANEFNIAIPPNPNSSITSHVFFKVQSNTQIGEFINIHVNGNLCGTNIDVDSVYQTKGTPHDPNQKTANVPTVPRNTLSKLLYTIKFQNDGIGPVNIVTVNDILPPELKPSSFIHRYCKPTRGTGPSNPTPAASATKTINFSGLNLPGLGHRNPSYGYDQTTHWFTYEVSTQQTVNTIIDNKAEVTFVGSGDPPLETSIARVTPVPACPLPTVNLVKNPDFRLGNDGSFQSGWSTPNCTCTAASYCVGNQFTSKCNAWPANSFDHTVGNANGSFLIFDGDPNNPATVWASKVPVTQNQIYAFSFWVKSIYAEAFPLGMFIDGVLVNTVKVAQPMPTWTEYRVSWQAPATKSIPISIKQMTKGAKRDFGLDDIFFGSCN